MRYELLVYQRVIGGAPTYQVIESTPFMAFAIGQSLDMPGKGSFPIREIHHMLYAPTPSDHIQRITLLI